MRIIAGKHRGRRLRAPPGKAVRPTADRARQAIFNQLDHAGWGVGGAEVVPGAAVLDAFCGSGALGLEALSRGAGRAIFMDTDRASLATARANAETLGEGSAALFFARDATDPPAPSAPCTLVFMDPPYRSDAGPAALAALAGRGWIAPDAICVLETAADGDAPDIPTAFTKLDQRRYGAARVTILRFTPEA